jgi:hypothetical protein
MMPRPAAAVTVTVALVMVCGCAPALKPIAPDTGARAELWDESSGTRDLFYGVGGRELAPPERPTFTLVERDPSGFSVTLDLRDKAGREWSAKLGEEAQSEVTASRIVWALGYHQVPSYYVPGFTVVERGRERPEQAARLRPKVAWLDSQDTWSWYQNPFVGTQAYRGLLVLMMVINSTDLKEANNTIYRRERAGQAPLQLFVVKDLGATFGTTGRFGPKRNDVERFEEHGFIKDVRNGRVDFHYRGRHQALLDQVTVGDVVWTCTRLSKLTDRQWDDAFRAGAYDEATRQRYIARIRSKVQEGLALGAREARR